MTSHRSQKCLFIYFTVSIICHAFMFVTICGAGLNVSLQNSDATSWRSNGNVVDYVGKHYSVEDSMHLIIHYAHIKELNIYAAHIDSSSLPLLAKLKSLERLSLSGNSVSNIHIAYLSRIRSIRVLSLIGSNVTDEGLIALAKLPKLTTLCLTDTSVCGSTLEHFNGSNLRSLYLNKTNISDRYATNIAALKSVEYLNLSQTNITSMGVLVIVDRLNHLKEIFLNSTATDDTIIDKWKSNRITYLGLAKTDITDRLIVKLNDMFPNLEYLDVHGTSVSLINSNLKYLKHIDISDTKVSDNSLLSIANRRSLKELILTGTNISNHGLKILGKMPSMAILDIGETRIDRNAVERLLQFSNLRELEIDAGVLDLGNMNVLTNLQKLTKIHISGITTDDDNTIVEKLKIILPNVLID